MDGDNIVVDVDNNDDGATKSSGSNNNDNNTNTTSAATTRSQMTNQFPYDYIVFCVNGRSRTPTAYLAFMMLFRRQRSEVATEFIKEACKDQRVSINASSKSILRALLALIVTRVRLSSLPLVVLSSTSSSGLLILEGTLISFPCVSVFTILGFSS